MLGSNFPDTMKREVISSCQGIYSCLSYIYVYELVGNFGVLAFQVLPVWGLPAKASGRRKRDKVEFCMNATELCMDSEF